MFSGSSETSAGRLYSTQWTHVPPGASGSSAMSATLRVPAGAPLQVSGGDTSTPSHAYLARVGGPSFKAALVRMNAVGSGTQRRRPPEKPHPRHQQLPRLTGRARGA